MRELSPQAQRLLQLAHESFSPTAQRAANVYSALFARLALDSTTGDAASETAPGLTGWSATRLVGIGLAVLGFATGAWVLGSSERELATHAHAAETSASNTRRVARSVAPDAQQVEDVDVRAVGRAVSAVIAVIDATPSAPLASNLAKATAPGTNPKRSSVRPAAARARSKEDATLVIVPAATRVDEAESMPTTARVEPSTESASNPAVIADDSLQRELWLLRHANAALTGHDAAAALAFADQHAALFPTGRLSQERVAVRALASCALGRISDARLAAQELERIAPRSPHLMRLREACLAPRGAQL